MIIKRIISVLDTRHDSAKAYRLALVSHPNNTFSVMRFMDDLDETIFELGNVAEDRASAWFKRYIQSHESRGCACMDATPQSV